MRQIRWSTELAARPSSTRGRSSRDALLAVACAAAWAAVWVVVAIALGRGREGGATATAVRVLFFGFGVFQWLYVIPLYRRAVRSQRRSLARGLLMGAVGLLLFDLIAVPACHTTLESW